MIKDEVKLRSLLASDLLFMQAMTYEAAISGFGTTPPTFEAVMQAANEADCFEDWGNREGDGGLVVSDLDGKPLGAAWYRMYPGNDLGWLDEGLIDAPELIQAVGSEFRGRGIGKLLLRELTDQARVAGFRKLRANVLEDNMAARRLYDSHGFEVAGSGTQVLDGKSAPALKMVMPINM
jgi:GNAT superfamily N-acetyltransferase